MTKEIYFSCIITCYNRENLIHHAIESILNQSYTNFEIVIIDDCSTDNSLEVINRYANSQVKVFSHQINKGQNAALNTGIEHSNYEYLAFLDSDDVWEKDYLLEMCQAYLQHPNISFAYCNIVNGSNWTLDGPDKYANVLNQGFLSSMITITAKKEAVMEVGGFDIKYKICQDDDFCFRMSKKFSFKLIDKKLAKIGVAENSMTRNLFDVASGWAFLFKNYRTEIELYCGSKAYARHLLNVANLFFGCGKFNKGIEFFSKAIFYYFKKSNNQFDFSLKDLFYVICKIVKTIFTKTKSTLGIKIRKLSKNSKPKILSNPHA